MLVAGVDEAGRGPVFGPMVIAIAVFDEKDVPSLSDLGVKDSKELNKGEREELFKEIINICTFWDYIVVDPHEIDASVGRRGLNELEARKIAELIERTNADVVYVDSPDPDPRKFAERIKRYLECGLEIVAENGADKKYLPASAASIIAKHIRDLEIKRIKKIYGDFGSGYPGDERTARYLEAWFKKYKKLPPFTRKSWLTAKRLLEKETQRNLFDFV